MPSFNTSMILVILSLLSFLSLTGAQVPNYRYHVCSNGTTMTFTPNSTYQFNLNYLLSSLSPNATRESGFYNATAGQSPATTIYGLFLCRGDLTTNACQDCVATATREIVQQYCPLGKEAMVWYDECMLRYSNRSIFSTVEEEPSKYLWNVRDITEPDRFRKLVEATLNDSVPRAANASSGAKKFAVKEASFTELQTLYSLVQCTPDISSSDCNMCLRAAMANLPMCCDGKQGGRVLFPSCNLRYETYPFYQIQSVPTPSPSPTQTPMLLPPPAPGQVTRPKGKSKSITLTLALGIPIVRAGIIVAIFLGCLVIFSIRQQKKRRLAKESQRIKRGYFTSNLMVCWKRDAKNDHFKTEEIIKKYGSMAPKRYTYSDVKKLTNSLKEKVGQGGYGVVYKGKLPDGRMVAIKILSASKGNGEEFINEVASISGTSHVNIVTLLGFCYERTKRALIYEFMPNGSLDRFIYDKGSPITNCYLDSKTMFQIAVGIARGLEYLHRGCNTRILHFDIKPHNILLDEDLCPKISDFGLAKLCKTKESIVSMTGMRGTAGFIAPEVFSRSFGGVSHKSDVYSYGMLVLEMVKGRENFDGELSHTSETYFPHWIYTKLEQGKNSNTFENIIEVAEDETTKKMIIVSLWCIQTNPSNRPSIGKAIEMLEGSLQALPFPPKPFLDSPTRSP